MTSLQALASHLDSLASCAVIALDDPDWHTKAFIPAVTGWYYIRTNTPVEVLQQQQLWSATYTRAGDGKLANVRNYDIAERAQRYADDLKPYWNTSEVYSGLAKSLQARAREHTFADPGTAGLALARYPVLRQYEWMFGFITLSRFSKNVSCPEMMLRLGEQIWRAKNGWPLLCAH